MSQQDVELVRAYYEALDAWLEGYWADPGRPLGEGEGFRAVDTMLTDDAEWDWLFGPETWQGREQLLGAVADWLETVTGWRVELEEVIDGTEGRVVAIIRVVARGKGSGAPILQPVFSVVTVRDGKITRIDDYTEREKGLAAAGL
jgi:ketosteroid isomerase-like protein